MIQSETTQMALYLAHPRTLYPFGLETGQGKGFWSLDL